nr:hypothetical protein [Tanacetum cinerariifolium]
MSNPHPKRNFVPRAVLMRSSFKTLNTARQNSSRAVVSVNTARQLNTAYPRPTMKSARAVSKDSPGDGFKPLRKEEKKDTKDPRNEENEVLSTEEPKVNKEKDSNVNSTNNINIVSSTDNAAGIKDNVIDKHIVYGCADNPNMPNLEEIVY